MSRPTLAPNTPIDILLGEWTPGTFFGWTREGAMVATQGGHSVIVHEDSVRLLVVHVPRYLPLWDRGRGSWRIVDTSTSALTVASFSAVRNAASMAERLNTGQDERGEYEWTGS